MASGILKDGSATVAAHGTRVPLSATAKTMANWITFYAKAGNSGNIYIGGSTVSSTSGAIMGQGDAFVTWPMVAFNAYDLNQIYIDSDNDGEGVQFVYTSI